jgi:translin
VENAAYLNGLGEAVGELRRYLLDSLRDGDVARCERYLRAMDDIYDVLVTVDYPDAMTGGLRRTTDVTRGILERTRGDLTMAARQSDLERRLAAFESRLPAQAK